jgi:hypothetical protein
MITTTMREAFAQARVSLPVSPLAALVVTVYNKGSGRHQPKQMWNADLSFRTYQSLKRQGIMA